LESKICHKNPQKCTLLHFSGWPLRGQRKLKEKINEIKNLQTISKSLQTKKSV